MLGFGLGLNKWRRVGGGFVGLLDLYPNAAAAYSLRLLRKDYSGGLVRARAWDGSANQGEADVMAYRVSATEYVLDLNSTLENLDATAISRGLTTSDTLADLVSTGVNDYDGLTSAWYDQSLSNDATQGTATDQPKIVSGGSLVTENGKPAIDFDGVDDVLDISGYTIVTTLNEVAAFVVYKQNVLSQISGVLNLGSAADDTRFFVPRLSSNSIRLGYGDSQSLITAGAQDTVQHLVSAYTDLTNINFNVDNASSGSSAIQNVTIVDTSLQLIGNVSNDINGKVQEVVVYDSNQYLNVPSIEANINTFYSIYP